MIKLNQIEATYTTVRGKVKAVDGINLAIPNGIILGVAGESGCGKSTLIKSLYGDIGFPLGLQTGGIEYGIQDDKGVEITTSNIRKYWFRRISYVPQSSMNSLNPVQRINRQFVDFLGPGTNEKQVLEEVRAYVKKLDLPPEAIDSYPHQLSGGMRQRIMIAMATYFNPDLILADEPTTALDVVVQKGILQLLTSLQALMKNTIVFVSHDMGVHYQITHKMLIMYAAKAFEFGDTDAIFAKPLHPYTKMLIESLPTVGDDQVREGVVGRPPSLWGELKGCRFAERCPLATGLCYTKEPDFVEYNPGHFAACHYAENNV